MAEKNARNILINGWYGQDNAGDDAILEVFVDQFRSRYSGNISVLCEQEKRIDEIYSGTNVRGVHHWELLGLRGIENILRGRAGAQIRALKNADLLVFGGGSLLRDNTTWRNLLRNLDEFFLARLFGVPIALYAIGVGPFKSRLGKWIIKQAVKLVDIITVRDNNSKQLLIDLGIDEHRIHVVADPAFLLQSSPFTSKSAAQPLLDFVSGNKPTAFVYPTISLVPPWLKQNNPWIKKNKDALLKKMASAFDQLHLSSNFNFAFLPFQCINGVDDREVSRRIASYMISGAECYIHEQPLTPGELQYAATLPDINFTVRLHALILAASAGKPALSINYEIKVRNNAEMLGLTQYVAEISEDMDIQIEEKANLLIQNMEAEVERLGVQMAILRDSATKCFTLIFDCLEDR